MLVAGRGVCCHFSNACLESFSVIEINFNSIPGTLQSYVHDGKEVFRLGREGSSYCHESLCQFSQFINTFSRSRFEFFLSLAPVLLSLPLCLLLPPYLLSAPGRCVTFSQLSGFNSL